ncbi:MAG: metallophosphoesterase [Phycisphaerales bacterium]|nr:metallophosphoesterase [Phycisphaerales bacterium]
MNLLFALRGSRVVWCVLAIGVYASLSSCGTAERIANENVLAETYTFIYTSDLHYGQGGWAKTSQETNQAMIDAMNNMPLPSGVSKIDFMVVTGDIANRNDGTAANQSAAISWSQFQADYLGTENTGNISGGRLSFNVPIYLQVGNHDISNAIGLNKNPIDTTVYAQIYNRMLPYMKAASPLPLTNAATPLNYAAHTVNYSINVGGSTVDGKQTGGVHIMFVNMWPDKGVQAWMDENLKTVNKSTPVLLFTHAPANNPELRFFRNPAAPDTYNSTYQGLLPYTLGTGGDYTSLDEAKLELQNWLLANTNITAYFSGHIHSNGGFNVDPVTGVNFFRVDSPMRSDLSLLSYHVCTIDAIAQTLLVRQYFWHTGMWGSETTVSIAPRSCPNRAE